MDIYLSQNHGLNWEAKWIGILHKHNNAGHLDQNFNRLMTKQLITNYFAIQTFVRIDVPPKTGFISMLSNLSRGVLQCVAGVFAFALGINWYQTGSYFFKNLNLSLTRHFLKVDTHAHLITNDFKISRIHNWTLPEENNKGE